MSVKYIKEKNIIRTVGMNYSGEITEELEDKYIVKRLYNPDDGIGYDQVEIPKKNIVNTNSKT
jgi:hypothetical protein